MPFFARTSTAERTGGVGAKGGIEAPVVDEFGSSWLELSHVYALVPASAFVSSRLSDWYTHTFANQ